MEWSDDMDVDEIEVSHRKKRPQLSEQDRLKEEIYNRRCRLVMLSRTDYNRFKEYLLSHEQFFKQNFKYNDAEDMRWTCQNAMSRFDREVLRDDVKIFDRIFGYYIEPRKSFTIPVMGENVRNDNDPYRLPIERQVKWFYETTYEGFWNWISKPDTQDKLHYRNDLTDDLEKTIANNKLRNYEIVKCRRKYQPSDEETFAKVIALTKEVKI